MSRRSLGAQADGERHSVEPTMTGVRLSVRVVTVEDGLLLWQRRSDVPTSAELAIAVREHAAAIDAEGPRC